MFSFETIDLSENKEHLYLNALKIQKQTTLSWVGCYPVAREMVYTRLVRIECETIYSKFNRNFSIFFDVFLLNVKNMWKCVRMLQDNKSFRSFDSAGAGV